MNGSGVDDIFIRRDLSQGKYNFDRDMAVEFDTYSYDSYFYSRDIKIEL